MAAIHHHTLRSQLAEAEAQHVFDYFDPPGMLCVNVNMIDNLHLLKRVKSALGPEHVCDLGYVSIVTWRQLIVEPLRAALPKGPYGWPGELG